MTNGRIKVRGRVITKLQLEATHFGLNQPSVFCSVPTHHTAEMKVLETSYTVLTVDKPDLEVVPPPCLDKINFMLRDLQQKYPQQRDQRHGFIANYPTHCRMAH